MDHELTAKWHELDKVRVDLKEVAVLRPDLRVADGYIQYSTDGGSTWQNIIAVAELKGKDGGKGDPGAPGKDGSDATVTAANIAGALGYTPAAPGDIPVVPTAEIAANTKARHTHENLAVLDGITAEKAAAWDAKADRTAATASANGLMSKVDKAKLDGIAAGATKVTVDSVVSASSVNPVQNKAIKQYVDSRAAGSGAVRYDAAQTLTFEQKQQARKNAGALASEAPTITRGWMSICPDGSTDSNDAVHVTVTKAGDDNYTAALDGGPENWPVRVKGIRTPTDADTDAAANVEYVKAKVASGGSSFTDDGAGNISVDGAAAQSVNRFLQSLTFPGLNFKYINPLNSGTYSNPYGVYVGSGASLVDTILTKTVPGVYTVYMNRNATDVPAAAAAASSSLRGLVILSQIKKHYAIILLVDQSSNFYVQYIQGDVGGGWKQMPDSGADGITPTIGSNGNWYLGTTDTGKPSRGATGAKGEPGTPGAAGPAGAPGKDGKDGTNGITPTIGTNGNWYIGSTDTGKPSRGATGAKGDTGATGPAGQRGPQGPAGTPGKDGAKGDPGTPGAAGQSAYAAAQSGGYTGTQANFYADLAAMHGLAAALAAM